MNDVVVYAVIEDSLFLSLRRPQNFNFGNFYVVVLERTAKKCTKMQNALAGRAVPFFFGVFVHVDVVLASTVLKGRRHCG